MFFHHIFFFSSLALRLNTPAWFWSSSVEKNYHDSIRRCVCLCLRLKLLWHLISPAARSIVSNLTQFWSARSTFSCITSFTVSTFFVTDASLSTSSRLSYFWQIFCSKLPHVLSRALSFAMVAFSPALAENCINNVKWLRRVKWQILIEVMHRSLPCVVAPRGKCARIVEDMIFGKWGCRWGLGHLWEESRSVEIFERDGIWLHWIENSFKRTCN